MRTERFINIIDQTTRLDDLPRMPLKAYAAPARAWRLKHPGFYGYKPVTTGIAGRTVKWEVCFTPARGGIEVVFTEEFTPDFLRLWRRPPVLTTEDRIAMERFGHTRTLRVSQLFSDYSPATLCPASPGHARGL